MLKSVVSQEDQERQAKEAVYKGQKAQEIIDNPLHQEYMESTEVALFMQFSKVDYKDTGEMQRIHSELKAQQRHQRNYESAIKAGKIGLTLLERLANKFKQQRF